MVNRNQDITSVFSNKLKEWKYEQESRVILNSNNSIYINIEVVEIIFGLRVDENLKRLLIAGLGELKPNIIFKQQDINFQNKRI